MSSKSMIPYLLHWKNNEWDRMEKILAEDFEIEIYWLGMVLNKSEYMSMIIAITEERPNAIEFEIEDEIELGSHTVTHITRISDGTGLQQSEIIISEWFNKKSVKKCKSYTTLELDPKSSEKWIESFQKD